MKIRIGSYEIVKGVWCDMKSLRKEIKKHYGVTIRNTNELTNIFISLQEFMELIPKFNKYWTRKTKSKLEFPPLKKETSPYFLNLYLAGLVLKAEDKRRLKYRLAISKKHIENFPYSYDEGELPLFDKIMIKEYVKKNYPERLKQLGLNEGEKTEKYNVIDTQENLFKDLLFGGDFNEDSDINKPYLPLPFCAKNLTLPLKKLQYTLIRMKRVSPHIPLEHLPRKGYYVNPLWLFMARNYIISLWASEAVYKDWLKQLKEVRKLSSSGCSEFIRRKFKEGIVPYWYFYFVPPSEKKIILLNYLKRPLDTYPDKEELLKELYSIIPEEEIPAQIIPLMITLINYGVKVIIQNCEPMLIPLVYLYAPNPLCNFACILGFLCREKLLKDI